MTVRELNATKKWLPCLRCGRLMFTDRCHRICRKCHRRNSMQHVKERIRVTSARVRIWETDVKL